MISIDVNHPDVLQFAKIKTDKTKVTGANISIKLNGAFMKAVEANEDYILRFPCNLSDTNVDMVGWDSWEYNTLVKETYEDGSLHYFKKIKAKEYWNEFIKQAKDNAEPGLMYWDNVINYDPAAVYPDYQPITSNPCGEQFLQANDSCRLMVHNLSSYVRNPFTKEADFDFKSFYGIVYEGTRLGDDLVDLEVEYIQRIIDKIKSDPESDNIKKQELELWEKSKEICLKGRRIGMGITALADTLAMMNLKYDSDEALVIIDKIMKIKMEAELDCTIDLAILRGTFDGWDRDKEFILTPDGKGITIIEGNNSFYEMLCNDFNLQANRMIDYGRRNISWSTIAPTGSVSLLANNCTSGCEPLFQPYYMRRKKINPADKEARVDFTDQNGDKWQEFPVLHPKFKEWIGTQVGEDAVTWYGLDSISKESLQGWFEKSPWYNSCANDINWLKRVEIQAILQKYTTNAISSTINLPSTVTYNEVSQIYREGWKKGLKGQTIYVEGSRSGVLVSNTENKQDEFKQHSAPKRPVVLECSVHATTVKGKKYNVFVGMFQNKPFEIFATPYFTNEEYLLIRKVGKGKYNLETSLNETYSEDFLSELTDEEAAITRLISTSLRHGADIQFIVEQLGKTNGDITSFTKAISRILKKYISEEKLIERAKCQDCGSTNLIFEEGCQKCQECGSSKC